LSRPPSSSSGDLAYLTITLGLWQQTSRIGLHLVAPLPAELKGQWYLNLFFGEAARA